MTDLLGHIGPKPPATGSRAACASQHPIVTDTMREILADGGNAADAAVAGALVQAVVQQFMSNHAGSVTFLFWEASTGKAYQLDSEGTLVPDLPPYKPVPDGVGGYAGGRAPMACVPGFMPGLKAIYERFCTKPWAELCAPAVYWAENGYPVNSFELYMLAKTVDFYLWSESGRRHFTPDGFLPEVGQTFRSEALARTMRRLQEEGPDYFITGGWARSLVRLAEEHGWPLKLHHLSAIPPRWTEPLRYTHRDYQVVQLAPPQRQGVYTAFILGVLKHLDLPAHGHYSRSPLALYYMAHVLRRAEFEMGMLHDPHIAAVPVDTWLSEDYQRHVANIISGSLPKVDLTRHVELTSPPNAARAMGLGADPQPPPGSCELSIVDSHGNWAQMMHTLQGGGIPGEVLEGVPMVGSHSLMHMKSWLAGWLTGGGRARSLIGSAIVFRDGRPGFSLGSPGNVWCAGPQVMSNLMDYGMTPPEAVDMPRMLPLQDDYTLSIESRVPGSVVAGMARLGISLRPMPRYDYRMGSFQMCWQDADGTLHAMADARRAGTAAALD